MNYFKELRIAELISAYILGTIDDDGRRILGQWESQSECNRMLFNKLTKETIAHYYTQTEDETDIESVIEAIHSRIASSRRSRSKPKLLSRPYSWVTIAAGMFTILISLTVIVSPNEQPPTQTLSNKISNPASKVKIILPSGKELKLDEMSDSISTGNGIINREGSNLVFTPEESTSPHHAEPVMTTIVTEQGGELSFLLGDGTLVWLNTDSEFSFPMEFGNGERRVKLKGEAYFEVKHNPSKPFIVSTDDMDVRVLGTVFNVKSYPGDQSVSATLVSGSITVDAGGTIKELKPGFAATFDRRSGKMTVSATDTSATTAWLHGQLVFVDEGIDAVLRTLARWYDVEFVYDNPSDNQYTFNGRMTKYDPLNESLNRITLAGGPSFTIEGDTIYVR